VLDGPKSMANETSAARESDPYVGWMAAAIILAVIFAASAGLWFIFHP